MPDNHLYEKIFLPYIEEHKQITDYFNSLREDNPHSPQDIYQSFFQFSISNDSGKCRLHLMIFADAHSKWFARSEKELTFRVFHLYWNTCSGFNGFIGISKNRSIPVIRK